jgi:tripeptidyl-peptidase I
MFLPFLSLILLTALEATAGPVRKAAFPHHGWERKFLAPRTKPIRLHLAVRQDDGGRKAEQQLISISNPGSPSFRQHLGAFEAASLSIPAQHAVHDIEFWLWKYDLLPSATLFGGIYEIDTTVRVAERLLNTTYFVWSDGEQEIIRTELFYLPDTVAGHIDFIAPTTVFPRPALLKRPGQAAVSTSQRARQAQLLNERADCGSNSYVTPTCVRQVYQVDYQAEPNRTSFAVYATEAATFSKNDLQTYLSRYNQPAAAAHAQYQVSGSGDPNEDSSSIAAKFETALDTQVLLGLAYPAQGTLYKNGGVFGPAPGSTYDQFVHFLQELITNHTVPSVISFSESMAENMVDEAYAKRLCNMMAQVGARGVTLLFSSGNNGPNGDQPTGKHEDIFEPEFPASCPWVTAVGGTTDLADEKAATKSTINVVGRLGYTASGGGFSNLFSTPTYQEAFVEKYMTEHVPASYYQVPGFAPSGRGIPDVSAFSTNFPTVVDFITFPVGGTSSATPLWAAIITLLNDYEASKGRKSLGFINPWLYSLMSGLKDITKGGNNAGDCYLISGCTLPKTLGYNVTAGWDPVTGLGSPIFSELTKALDAIAAA